VEILQPLLELARSGGWVMIPLGAVSLIMWTLIAERMMTFSRLTRRDMDIQSAVHAVQGEPVNHFGHGLRSTLMRNYTRARTGMPELDSRILQECSVMLRPLLSRNLSVIAVLGSVAPLLGLLGTVSGMIATFNVISAIGTGNARPLAGGISEALVATEAGLLVAIPGLLLSAQLSRRASRLEHHLDQTILVLQHHLRGDKTS
jgi:biopolymer transport protein ExbB